jgi:LysM repeat protein
VADTLQSYGLEAIGLSNLSWDDLRDQISAGDPVIVWVIGTMWDGSPVEYKAQDGSTSIVAAFEHTMILTGYNQDTVQVVDAYSGQYQTYPLNMFIRSWAVLGNMAVFGSHQVANQDNPPIEPHGESYTVQSGDYLIALAKRFDTSWKELAELNSIGYPYIIHPGQVLSLPGGAEGAAEPEPEPVVTEPAPTNTLVNFEAHLPLVQREYVAQVAVTMINRSDSSESTQPVVAQSSTIPQNFGKRLGVDWQLQVRLKDLIFPQLIHSGILLKLK